VISASEKNNVGFFPLPSRKIAGREITPSGSRSRLKTAYELLIKKEMISDNYLVENRPTEETNSR